jgi:hypothetical protein
VSLRRGLVLALALVGLVLVGAVALRLATDHGGEVSAACEAGWAMVRPPRGDIVPRATDLAAGSGWIVGVSFVGGHGRTFAARPAGAAWDAVATPNVGPSYNVLEDVAIVSPDEAWAVGAYFDRRKIGRPLAERWNGERWEIMDVPDTGLGDAALLGVAADADGAWAVGSAATRDGQRPLVLRWEEGGWVEARAARPGPNASLADVALAGDGGAWAVGATVDEGGARSPLVERWDGERWRVVPTPSTEGSGFLSAITVVGPDDAWAAGATVSSEGSRPLVVHWDGAAWSVATIADPKAPSAFEAIDANGSAEAWAVGWVGDEDRRPLVQRWDGSTWRTVPSAGDGTLTTVGVGEAGVWIAGRRSTPEGLLPPLLARRCASGHG